MGFFDGIFKKIPFVSRFSKKKAPVNNVELQYNKAMNLMDNGDSEESVKILEQVADIGIMDTQYKSYGDDALLALAEFYEKGVYRNAKINVDMNKSTKYYEKYVNQNRDGDVIYKLAKMMLEIQNFSKAIKYFEMAATDYGIKAAYMSLGSIYESGLMNMEIRVISSFLLIWKRQCSGIRSLLMPVMQRQGHLMNACYMQAHMKTVWNLRKKISCIRRFPREEKKREKSHDIR